MLRIFIAAIAIIFVSQTAQARPHRYHHHFRIRQIAQPACVPDWFRPCQNNNFLAGVRSIKVIMHKVSVPLRKVRHLVYNIPHAAEQMLPHPHGCPSRMFCGCGAAVEIFGEPRRDLWLASNWLRFPRTEPAPGMAAARPGHVFVLKQHIEGDVWLSADYNSGGHLSRLHARSIRGYAIVNPRATAYSLHRSYGRRTYGQAAWTSNTRLNSRSM